MCVFIDNDTFCFLMCALCSETVHQNLNILNGVVHSIHQNQYTMYNNVQYTHAKDGIECYYIQVLWLCARKFVCITLYIVHALLHETNQLKMLSKYLLFVEK